MLSGGVGQEGQALDAEAVLRSDVASGQDIFLGVGGIASGDVVGAGLVRAWGEAEAEESVRARGDVAGGLYTGGLVGEHHGHRLAGHTDAIGAAQQRAREVDGLTGVEGFCAGGDAGGVNRRYGDRRGADENVVVFFHSFIEVEIGVGDGNEVVLARILRQLHSHTVAVGASWSQRSADRQAFAGAAHQRRADRQVIAIAVDGIRGEVEAINPVARGRVAWQQWTRGCVVGAGVIEHHAAKRRPAADRGAVDLEVGVGVADRELAALAGAVAGGIGCGDAERIAAITVRGKAAAGWSGACVELPLARSPHGQTTPTGSTQADLQGGSHLTGAAEAR